MIVNSGIYKKGVRHSELIEILGIVDKFETFEQGDFLWMALFEPSEQELRTLQIQLKLPELLVEDILHGGQQAKMEEYLGGLVFLSMPQFYWGNTNEQFCLQQSEVYLIASPQYLISVRRGQGGDFSKVRQRAHDESEQLLKGPGFVLYAIMDIIVDRYFPVIVEFERQLDVIEEKMISSDINQPLSNNSAQSQRLVRQLHDIRKQLSIFKQGIEPSIEATLKFFGGRVPKICDHLGEYFRDVHDHLTRISSTCDKIREDAALATQTNLALVTIEESLITKKLAAYAAIFAVVTLMAGIWGMNFEHMPELKWKYGYLMALTSMIVVSIAMRYKFKKVGWI